MQTILTFLRNALLIIGFFTVFTVSALIAGLGLGTGIAVFTGSVNDGRTVTGIGKITGEPVVNSNKTR